MERSLRWRIIGLGVLSLLAVLILLPSIVPSEKLPAPISRIFSKKVQLGLDLRGGLHLVYGIDLNKSIDDKSFELKRELELALKDADIDALIETPLTPKGALNMVFTDPSMRSKVDETFLATYEGVLRTRECLEDVTTVHCLIIAEDYAIGIKESAIQQAIKTIRERIDEHGIAEPTVIRKGDDIIVELPGFGDEVERIKSIIKRAAKLEFKIVANDDDYMKKLARHVSEDPKAKELGIDFETDSWVHDETGKRFTDQFLIAATHREYLTKQEAIQRGCWDENKAEREGKVECEITGRTIIAEYLNGVIQDNAEFAVDGNHEFAYEQISQNRNDVTAVQWRTYYLKRAVELAGSSVSDAAVSWDPTTNRPEVLVTFNRLGAIRFGELTSENVGKKMAIILDETVNSAPVIQAAITGGRSSITMGNSDVLVSQRESEDLVNVLRTGSLPAPLREESSSIVGPLLGLDAVNKAKSSFIYGSLLVIFLMLWFYRKAGAISVAVLLINVTLMMSILTLFQATLTLPGIAALVLTVGMAVDANIIIYERIREELRNGKSIRGAVDSGFSRAFSAIIDGQLTTGIAAYVLYSYGSGPIQGFAVMLMIGIICTLFTALWCTRLFFTYALTRKQRVNWISI